MRTRPIERSKKVIVKILWMDMHVNDWTKIYVIEKWMSKQSKQLFVLSFCFIILVYFIWQKNVY